MAHQSAGGSSGGGAGNGNANPNLNPAMASGSMSVGELERLLSSKSLEAILLDSSNTSSSASGGPQHGMQTSAGTGTNVGGQGQGQGHIGGIPSQHTLESIISHLTQGTQPQAHQQQQQMMHSNAQSQVR